MGLAEMRAMSWTALVGLTVALAIGVVASPGSDEGPTVKEATLEPVSLVAAAKRWSGASTIRRLLEATDAADGTTDATGKAIVRPEKADGAGKPCNDGNHDSGDGCDANGKVEEGWICKWNPHVVPGDACQVFQMKKTVSDQISKITARPIMFKPGKDELKAGAQETLDKVAKVVMQYPWMDIVVEASSPAAGMKGMQLVAERANAAVEQLKKTAKLNKFIKRGTKGRSISVTIFAAGYSPSDEPPNGCPGVSRNPPVMPKRVEPKKTPVKPSGECALYHTTRIVNEAMARTLQKSVGFHPGSTRLTSAGQNVLKSIADTLKMYPWMSIVVEGQSPATGLKGQRLTTGRAGGAAEYLAKKESVTNKIQIAGTQARTIGLVIYAAGSSPGDAPPKGCSPDISKVPKSEFKGETTSSSSEKEKRKVATQDSSIKKQQVNAMNETKLGEKQGEASLKKQLTDQGSYNRRRIATVPASKFVVTSPIADTLLELGEDKNKKSNKMTGSRAAETEAELKATKMRAKADDLESRTNGSAPDARGVSQCRADPAYEKKAKEGKTKELAARRARAESRQKERKSKELVRKNEESTTTIKAQAAALNEQKSKARKAQAAADAKLREAKREAVVAKAGAEKEIAQKKYNTRHSAEKETKRTKAEVKTKTAKNAAKLAGVQAKEKSAKDTAKKALEAEKLSATKAEVAEKKAANAAKMQVANLEKHTKVKRKEEVRNKHEASSKEQVSKENTNKKVQKNERAEKEKELTSELTAKDQARLKESKAKKAAFAATQNEGKQKYEDAKRDLARLKGASKSAANAEASKDAALRNSQKAAEKGDKKLARAKSPVAKKIAAKKDKALRKKVAKEEGQAAAVADAAGEKMQKSDAARARVEAVQKTNAYLAIGHQRAQEELVKERASKVNEKKSKAKAKENQVKGRSDELTEKADAAEAKSELSAKVVAKSGNGEAGEKATINLNEAAQKKRVVEARGQENEEKSVESSNKATELSTKSAMLKAKATGKNALVSAEIKKENAKVLKSSEANIDMIKREDKRKARKAVEKGEKAQRAKDAPKMKNGQAMNAFEKGEKAGIREEGGGKKDCKDAKSCPPGLVLKKVCIKSIYKSCCKQCIKPGSPAFQGVPEGGAGKPRAAAPSGGASWKEVWQKNMARWRNAVGSTENIAGLSQAELSPSTGNAVPYENAGEVKQNEAAGAGFTDGQDENVVPNANAGPAEMTKAASATRSAMIDAAVAKAKKSGPDPPGKDGTPGWKEIWEKNMQRWNNALVPGAKAAGAALSGAQAAPKGGDGKAYPKGLPKDQVSKKAATKAPFN